MDDDSTKWLDKFKRINGVTKTPAAVDGICEPAAALSNSARKPPHRLGRALALDRITVTITQRRARAGLKPKGFSR